MNQFGSSHHSQCPAVPLSLPALREQYSDRACSIRAVVTETLKEELIYLQRLFDHFGSPDTAATLFARIRPATINAFLVEYARTHGLGSRRWMQFVLRSFLRFAYQYSHLKRDLSALVPSVRTPRMARLPRVLPDDCIAALDSGIKPDNPAGLRDSALVCLLATYGVRGIQIRRLCLQHVDWENGYIHFPAAKGGRPIQQYLTPKAGNRLTDYPIHGRPQSSRPEIFLTLREPFRPFLGASYFSAIIHRRMKELGVNVPAGVSAGTHGFRHAFASRMIGNVPFKNIVDMLGHRDPSSTLIYAKIDHSALSQAALPWPGGEQ
jgi:integrase/recombinase XerD